MDVVPSTAPYVSVRTIAGSKSSNDFKQPYGAAVVIPDGTILVADAAHHQIRTVTPQGVTTVLAGSGKPGRTDGTGDAAQFKDPQGIAVDSTRRLIYVADSGNHVIRRITFEGVVSTLAGSGRGEDRDGVGADASFKEPVGLAVDVAGNLYVADSGNDKIRKVTPSGAVTTFAGAGRPGYGDGAAAQALFKGPRGIAVSSAGIVYVADTKNHAIRKIAAGVVSTVAGTTHGGSVDGSPNVAEFKEPSGVAVDDAGDLWIADTKNHQIRRITADGLTTTVAGDGKPGFVDGTDLLRAGFHEPAAVAAAGAIYIADSKNDAIRVIDRRVALSDIAPRTADPRGGSEARLFGSGFVPGATQVTFGGAPATVTYVSSTELRVIVPAGTAGYADVVATTPAGSAALTGVFQYLLPYIDLRVVPSSVALFTGGSKQLTATAVGSDNSTTNVTLRATWTSAQPAIATVDANGLVRAIAAGRTPITATFEQFTRFVDVEVSTPEPVPPDPASIAPQMNPTIVSSLQEEISFLYSGPNAIQTGVAPDAITEERATVFRGRVRQANGQPLPAAKVSVLNHPEFGETLSRADGVYDLVVNGGGALTLKFEKSGYISAQRLITSQWNQQKRISDVMLVRFDDNVTTIALGSATAQVARGSAMIDSDGARRATLIIPSGTTAMLAFPDGSTRSVSSLSIRATEFTVGPNGPKAMPAALPPTSAYTYCVELSADEAVAESAAEVRFSRAMAFYVENFLNFPVGGVVPVGYYDRTRASWMSSDNGRVVKIVSISGGLAQVDTNGDGAADNALGIDAAEQQQLATLYATGRTLWRVPATHFTPFDCNWPYAPPVDAAPPADARAYSIPAPERGSKECGWSVVDCTNQTLVETIHVTGTPFSIEYNSARAASARNRVSVQLTGASLPPSLRRVDLTIGIAGRSIERTFAPQANLSFDFTWDEKDVYGRTVQGARNAAVSVGYVYQAVYTEPRTFERAWAATGNLPLGVSRAASEITFFQTFDVRLGQFQGDSGFGGWTFDAQRMYDDRGRVIYDPAGEQRSSDPMQTKELGISTIAGTGECCNVGEGVLATAAKLDFPLFAAAAPDGTIYFSELGRIKKIDTNGILTTVAGNGTFAFTSDGLPANGHPINAWDIAVGPDGSLYINDQGNSRVRRVVDGILTTVAGNGTQANSFPPVNGVPAKSIAIKPEGIAVGPDGSLYIAEGLRILRVTADGIATTIGGDGTSNATIDGSLATRTAVRSLGIAVGPDGSVYYTDATVVRRIGTDGRVTRVAGALVSESADFVEDGQRATAGRLDTPWGIDVASDGTVLVMEQRRRRLRAIGVDGIITTLAGNGARDFRIIAPNGTLARGTSVTSEFDVDVAPDGSTLVMDSGKNVLRRIDSTFPRFRAGQAILPSADGSEVYFFEGSRHVRTAGALIGATLDSLEYDGHGFLTTIRDGDGNVTTIERNAQGDVQAIVAPGGQRTTLTATSGQLTTIANPAGESYTFAYIGDGLLSRLTDPRGGLHKFTYDENGLLTKDEDPAGGFIALTRSGVGGNFTVARTSAEGRSQSYQLSMGGDQSNRRSHVGTDGLSTASSSSGGSTTSTTPDGTSVTVTTSADPRFGTQAAMLASATMTMPSGLRSSITHSRSVTLTNALDPRSISTITDIASINGRAFRSVFDAATRTVTSTSPAGRTSTATLDAKARLVSSSIPGLATSSYVYDGAGRIASVGAGARIYTFGYNTRHELIRITDPLQRSVGFTYDAAGRVSSQSLPGSRTISFASDAHGNLTSITPPDRPAHQFNYTPIDLQDRYEPPSVPASGVTRSVYNHDRQLTSIIRPDALTIGLEYDSGGRLSTLTTPSGAYRYGYNANTGNLMTIMAPDETLTYSYDGSLPTSVAWAGTVSGSVSWSYDNNLRLTSENGVAFSYDGDGLLIQAGALSLQRDPQNGLLIGTVLEAFTDENHYNEHAEIVGYSATRNGTPIFSATYTRDDAGRIIAKGETVLGSTIATSYIYDAAGRLESNTIGNIDMTTYGYDANGNRVTKTRGTSVETGVYDAQDRLTSYAGASYAYTAKGELLTKTDAAGTTRYDYDVLGNLRKVALPDGRIIEYIIDGQNRRVGKKVDGTLVRGWIYGSQLRIVAELDGSGSVISRFIYGSRTNVPDYITQGAVTYRIIPDHLGSPRLVVDSATGVVRQMIGYDEYGVVLSDTNPAFQPFAFAGGLYDPDTGLVRFGARDYDPHTGRWTTKDPIGFSAGDANLYEYVSSSPVDYIDPSGLSGWLTIYSSYGGGSSGPAMFDSHSWIVYMPDGGASTSYGTFGFGTPAPRGLNTNWELAHWSEYADRSKYAVFSRTQWLDDAQEAALMATINSYRRQGDDAWTSSKTCSTFAGDAWRSGTGENLQTKTKDDSWPNPVTLSKSILGANGGLGSRVLRRRK